MSRPVLLDSSVAGLLSNPNKSPQVVAITRWSMSLLASGNRVILPEIVDYEIRRELLLIGKKRSIAQLDSLGHRFEYLPITTAVMRRAAELWAQARQIGQPTAGSKTLDADMILCAQAQLLNEPDAVIATTNLRHLTRFAPAKLWQEIDA